MSGRRIRGLVLAACVAAVLVTPAAAPAQTPTLAQLPGSAGCIGGAQAYGCTKVTNAPPAGSLAPSPDGRHVYVTGMGRGGYTVSALRRDPVSGALSEGPCLSYQPLPGCKSTYALLGAKSSVVSPDGRNVYTVTDGMMYGTSGAVVIFARDPVDGSLTQTGCVGAISRDCPDRDVAVAGATSVVVTPDGRHVYVAAQHRLLTFARSAGGMLTRVGCVGSPSECEREPDLREECRWSPTECRNGFGYLGSRVALSADSRRLYFASDRAHPQVFVRDPGSGLLTGLPPAPCNQLGVNICGGGIGPSGLAVARDGRDVYSVLSAGGGEPSLMRSRHPTGLPALVPVGCIAGTVPVGCAHTETIGALGEVAMAPGDGAVYAAYRPTESGSRSSSGITVLARNRSSGSLTEAGCVTNNGSDGRCVVGPGLDYSINVAVSPDGRNVYVGGPSGLGLTGQIAVLGPAVAMDARAVRFDPRGRARLRLSCPKVARVRCRGRMALASAEHSGPDGRTVTARRFSIAPGRRARVRVSLSRVGRRTLRRGGRLEGKVTLRAGGRVSGRSVREVTLRRSRR